MFTLNFTTGSVMCSIFFPVAVLCGLSFFVLSVRVILEGRIFVLSVGRGLNRRRVVVLYTPLGHPGGSYSRHKHPVVYPHDSV